MNIRAAFLIAALVVSTTLLDAQVAPVQNAATGKQTFSMDVGADAVQLSGATAGKTVALFAVLREVHQHFYATLRSVSKLLEVNEDGSVIFSYGKPIPPNSVWAAVDLQSGTVVTSTPAGTPSRDVAAPETVVEASETGSDTDEVVADHIMLRTLWVHPGNNAGAWVGVAADGSESDSDRKPNGRIHLDASQFTPLGASGTPPKHFTGKDVVVAIDPFTMELFSKEVIK